MKNNNNDIRLKKLLFNNKAKKIKLEVIDNFKNKTSLNLTINDFLDLKKTDEIRKTIYMFHGNYSYVVSKKFKNLIDEFDSQEKAEVLSKLYTSSSFNFFKLAEKYHNKKLALLHYEDCYCGAILIYYKDFVRCFIDIIKFLGNHDIAVMQEELKFGFCFEILEHEYILKEWY